MRIEQEKTPTSVPKIVGETGPLKVVITVVAVGMSLFQLYTAGFGSYPSMVQRSIHAAFGFFLAYAIFPMIKREKPSTVMKVIDLVLGLLAVYTCLHIVFTFDSLVERLGLPTRIDIILGGIMLVLLVDMGRRTIGWPLPLIAIGAMLYSYLGPYMPGFFTHRGVSIPNIIAYMYTTTEGVFGLPMGVSATVVFAFILFGTFLIQSGTGDFITDAAYAIAGKARGGPAKIAVFSSGFFGMISGSVVANVVSTGSFTIPLMKKMGFKPHFAAAVEAAASTGGQIMPPVMGAAVFIMAEIIGLPYVTILFAAAIPATLYFLSLFFIIHLRSVKMDIKGLEKEELPRLGAVIKRNGHLLIPPIFLVFILIAIRYSPMKTAFLTIPIIIMVSMVRKHTRFGVRKIIAALEQAAVISVQIVAACGLAGIVMAVVTQTGVGLKFSNLLVTLGHQNLFFTLLLVMITSIILGTGVTTSAAYIVTSLLGASALENLGVPTLAAHLFILYYAVISFITPPVAIGAYAAAGIADANPFRTGFEATRIGLAGFIVPFMFVYGPSLILMGSIFEIVLTTTTAVIGILALAGSLEGYLFKPCALWERIILFAIALALIKPGVLTDAVGTAAALLIFLNQKGWSKCRAALENGIHQRFKSLFGKRRSQ